MTQEKREDKYFLEKIEPIYEWSNGARTFAVEVQRTSNWFTTYEFQPTGGTKEVYYSRTLSLDRLVIGKNGSRYRFQIIRFTKQLEDYYIERNLRKLPVPKPRPQDFEYVGDEWMERYEGLSLTEETLKKVLIMIGQL